MSLYHEWCERRLSSGLDLDEISSRFGHIGSRSRRDRIEMEVSCLEELGGGRSRLNLHLISVCHSEIVGRLWKEGCVVGRWGSGGWGRK